MTAPWKNGCCFYLLCKDLFQRYFSDWFLHLPNTLMNRETWLFHSLIKVCRRANLFDFW